MKRLLFFLAIPALLLSQAPITSDRAAGVIWPRSTFDSVNYSSSPTGVTWFNSATTAGEFCGPLIPSATGSSTVTAVGLHDAGMTYAGGSTYTLQVYAAATAVGPPAQPTGSSLLTTGTLTMNATNTPASTWHETSFTSSASLTPGTVYCVVGAPVSYAGSDSFAMDAGISRTLNYETTHATATAYTTSPVWTLNTNIPFMYLKMSDGSYGTLGRSLQLSSGFVVSAVYNNTSTDKEYGNQFSFPNSGTISGVCFAASFSTSATLQVNIYNAAGTAVATVTPNPYQMLEAAGNSGTSCYPLSTPVVYPANQTWTVAVSATSSTSITLYGMTVFANGVWTLSDGGDKVYEVYRATAGSGSWTSANTSRMALAFQWSAWGNKGASGGQQ